MFMKFIHELNCEHCGKYFTKAFNLWEIFHKIITLNAHIKRTHKAQRNYDCDSCGKSSILLGNLNIHITGIHAGQRNYKCVLCRKYITKLASLMNLIKIIHQGQRNHECDSCGKFYTQMTNLKNNRISNVIVVKNSPL